MKVALLNTLYHPYRIGGAERSVQLLAEGLVARGHKVVVITLDQPETPAKKETINGVDVYRVPLHNNYWPFADSYRKPSIVRRALWHCRDRYNKAMARQVEAILERERPELLHTHNVTGFSVAVWNVAKSLALPVVHTIRDYSLLCPRNAYRKGRNCSKACLSCLPFLVPKRKASVAVDVVVGISRFVLERHLEWGFFPHSKRAVVYNPVGPTSCAESRFHGQEEGPLRIGFLGALAPHKGIEDLLRAVEEVNGQFPLRVLIAGKGERTYEVKLRERAKDLPVEFLGYVPAAELFSQIDILAVPSRWHEPFGRIILEAYSNAIPVIASSRGGIPEIVDEGRTGWLYNPDDSKSLAHTLGKVYKQRNKLREMGIYARNKSLAFTVEAHVKQYLEIYRMAAAGGRNATFCNN